MICTMCNKGVLDNYFDGKRCLRCDAAFDAAGNYVSVYDTQKFSRSQVYESKAKTLGPAHPEKPKTEQFLPSDDEYAKHVRLSRIKKKPKRYKIGNSWI